MLLKILQISQEKTCAGVPYLIKLQAELKKEASVQVFYCKFCKIFKGTFLKKTPPDDCFCVEYKCDNTKMIRIISYPISSSLSSKYCSLLLLKTTFTLFYNFPFFYFFHYPICLLVMFTNNYRMNDMCFSFSVLILLVKIITTNIQQKN